MFLDTLVHDFKATVESIFMSRTPSSAPNQHVQKRLPGENTENQPSAYPYRELQGTDIRLVRILPGEDDDIIECHMDQVPLDSEPRYFAVSYVWGDPSDTIIIKLNGQSFEVTKSVYELLYQFRQLPDCRFAAEYDPRHTKDYFWIDSICINQDDIEEKSREVPRMVDIYGSCTQVLIWLGPNGPPSKNGIKKLLRKTPIYNMGSRASHLEKVFHPNELTPDDVLEEIFKRDRLFYTSTPDDEADDVELLRKAYGGLYNIMLRAWAEILSRPWFSRTWTIQEACVPDASTVYIGRHTTSFNMMCVFVRVIGAAYKPLLTTNGFMRLISIDRIRDMRRIILDLEHEFNPIRMHTAEVLTMILSHSTKKQCSDPRDQIYGIISLLGFLGNDIPTELLPDYSQSYEDLCWKCTVYILESIGDLQLLDSQYCLHQTGPSWVADFRYTSFRTFSAKREPSVRLSPDKRTLCLQGFVIGTYKDHIGWCSAKTIMPHPHQIPRSLTIRLQAVEERILEPSALIRKTTVENSLDGFMKGGHMMFDQWELDSWRRTYRRLSGFHGEKFWMMKRKLNTARYGKEFVIADEFSSGFMLLSNGTIVRIKRYDIKTQPGDLVCLFKGATLPSILRPFGDDGDYIFLGQCDIRAGDFADTTFDDDFWKGRELEEFRLV